MSSLVPKGWKAKKIGDFLISLPKSKLPSSVSNESGYYNFYVCSHNVLKSFYNEMSLPAVLFSTGGEAAVHYAIGKYSYSTDVWAINFKDEIYNEYAFRVFDASLEKINYSGFQGSGIKHLDKKFIKDLTFAIPPLPEQKKILSILTSVDEVIENTQKQIDKLQDLKKATMKELLTKGIGHTEFKDSELGRIPKSWEFKALNEIVSIPNGQVDPKIEPYASMPHIGSGNIISWTGQIKDVQTAYQSGQISGKYLFNVNHILYSKVRPNLAKVCMPQCDGVCSADIYPLLPKEQISDKFIFQYLLTEQFTKTATEVSERTGMPKINRQDLSVIKLPVPPFKEQLEIAKIIESIDDAMSLKTKKLSQTQFLKKSFMQDLLTGKVRVSVN
jgi:type I restriction enzyme, S subunit